MKSRNTIYFRVCVSPWVECEIFLEKEGRQEEGEGALIQVITIIIGEDWEKTFKIQEI